MVSKESLIPILHIVSEDLDRCMNFWIKYSHDQTNGGFFNCLTKEGKVYDENKYGWMQGRQTWTYAWLYNESSRFKQEHILQAAEKGAQFMLMHMKQPDTWKCYFLVTKDGKPIKMQRTIYTECFYTMAMSELFIATKKRLYEEEAVGMMDKIVYWVREDGTDLGRPNLEGLQSSNTLAVPMMVMSLIIQMERMDSSLAAKYKETTSWCIDQTLAHIQKNGTWILENIPSDGGDLSGPMARVSIPGHAIEGGWFLLQIAKAHNNAKLKEIAIEKFMVNPFNYGWDKEFGGLYYFLDSQGFCPVQLEWNMKLWWPHNEAMIAFLMAYQETRNTEHFEKFQQVFNYSYKHFVDKEIGEWYGYCSREGKVALDFKGGPFKGNFHVARCLFMCEKILKNLVE